jgi:hypothetical protein
MTKLVWDAPKERYFEAAVDRGVLYVGSADGVVWNGLQAVDEKPANGTVDKFYIDGYNYVDFGNVDDFEATLSAITFPPEFGVCDGTGAAALGLYGTQQPRQSFGLSWRTQLGNATQGLDYGYRIHLLYNCLVAPTPKSFSSLGSSVNPVGYSWDISAVPFITQNAQFVTAHYIIDTTVATPPTVQAVEAILYGDDDNAPRLPDPDELIALFESTAYLDVEDNGDGTATITGPDTAIVNTDVANDLWTLTWPSVIEGDNDTYQVSSL